jgi:hypothetical protein
MHTQCIHNELKCKFGNIVAMQFDDDDEIIEYKIKESQKENGRLMISTSQRLRHQYSDEQVTKVINRLSRRRQRGNQYEKQSSNITNITKLEHVKSKVKENPVNVYIKKYEDESAEKYYGNVLEVKKQSP